MNLQLKDKTAFITGSTAGIGFATAKTLLSEGAKVIINGRTEMSVNKAVSHLKKDFPYADITGIAANFGVLSDINNLFKQLPRIDILIQNVGIYTSGSFLESTDEDWLHQFEINVMSGVRLSRELLPKMLANNCGRILFISSECAVIVPPDLIAYSVTKTALLAVSKGLSNLTKGTNVTVNVVMPGSTLTEGAESFLNKEAEISGKSKESVQKDFFTNTRTNSLLQRFATVNEIATTITYLASPLSSATNGAVIKVDGGSSGGLL